MPYLQMKNSMRIALPLVQMLLAVGLTWNAYHHPTQETLGRAVLFALNAPVTVVCYCLETLAMFFCPSQYMTSPSTGCYPIQFIFETVIYIGLVGLLWFVVSLEVAGRGRSILTPKTGARAAVDLLATFFGVGVVAFGIVWSGRLGRPLNVRIAGITFLVWGIVIVSFYGRDLWLQTRRTQR
jgi:hypothetical protein